MPAQQGGPDFDDIARRWHDLAERRLAHFAELYHSGRWRHYYQSEAQFAARMREAVKAAKIWALMAGCELPSVNVPVAAEPASSAAAAPAETKPGGLRPAA